MHGRWPMLTGHDPPCQGSAVTTRLSLSPVAWCATDLTRRRCWNCSVDTTSAATRFGRKESCSTRFKTLWSRKVGGRLKVDNSTSDQGRVEPWPDSEPGPGQGEILLEGHPPVFLEIGPRNGRPQRPVRAIFQ